MRRENGTIRLVIVTASHVLNMFEHVYMTINNNFVDVGECIYSPNEGYEDKPSLFDNAVVEIKNDMEGHFHCDVLDKSNGRQSFKILPGICDIYTQVWKHGATTHLTTGVVTSPEFTINSNGKLRNVTIIEGITKDFAEPGDSGASVLLQESGETYGLGVIVGESSADQHPPDESTKNCITARLNKAIERFESNTKNKLLIGTAD
ncbi:hypothetical protein FSP39_018026 [Pinctada imbricata]|uniref:Peptidase S1 domain-containing protein n=1 Tax=Pinctada imbricata TaxID=66713 RepID=A0AA88YRP6_PINIB|nr:hypothetical protein FSP39_018026 [Pinctada imbricata]